MDDVTDDESTPLVRASIAVTVLVHDEDFATKLGLEDLAIGAAQLHVEIEAEQRALDAKAARLNEAKKVIQQRFGETGTDQIRVETTDGKRLVYESATYFVSVPADQKDQVIAWLKTAAPDLVAEQYNAQAFTGHVRRAHKDNDGEFPAALVEAGVVKITEGKQVKFKRA